MANSTGALTANAYEFELTAGREEIAELLNGVVDGILTGAIRLGTGANAVSIGVPEDLSLEIEFEDGADETSLELELEWLDPEEDSLTKANENRAGRTAEEPMLASAADGSESMARFEVFRDRGEEWRWRLRHRNGNIIAVSGEGYTRKHDAQKGLHSVIENSANAEVTETSTN